MTDTFLLYLFFFFNDTATTEIYTYTHSFPTRRSSDLGAGGGRHATRTQGRHRDQAPEACEAEHRHRDPGTRVRRQRRAGVGEHHDGRVRRPGGLTPHAPATGMQFRHSCERRERAEERSVGKEGVRTCRYRWLPEH